MKNVLILGGGLAGLAAASALAPRGFHITLLESRNRLGGRASSFQDARSGQLVDNCQHVSMGCCTNFAHFRKGIGIAHHLQPQKSLYFMTPDGRVSKLFADKWPAPLHLARSFLAAHYLTLAEKMRIAYGLLCLQRTLSTSGTAFPSRPATTSGTAWESRPTVEDDPPFAEWLQKHRQTQRTIDRFWSLVLVSALNETPDRIGLKYARKVFVDGFLRHRRGFEVEIPTVPLGQLYGDELQQWLQQHNVEVRLQQRVKQLVISNDRINHVELSNGAMMQADWYISALPFDRLLDVMPEEVIARHEYFHGLKNLQTSPITSVHLWLDRRITDLPHVVMMDSVSQWLFYRGETTPGEHYYQVVVSAARQYRAWGQEEIQRRIVDELQQFFPACQHATVLRSRAVTEHTATFSAVPGVDRWRPVQTTPVDNLLVAGDWTATDWPATMEGAVRSGYLAAEALLRKIGEEEKLVQPDLR